MSKRTNRQMVKDVYRPRKGDRLVLVVWRPRKDFDDMYAAIPVASGEQVMSLPTRKRK